MSAPPPYNLDLEQAVLGAVLIDKDAINDLDMLESDCFHSEKNRVIWRAVQSLYQRREPVDLVTVTNEIRTFADEKVKPTALDLVDLSNRVASTANLEYHSRILLQYAMRRRLIKMAVEVQANAMRDDLDPFEISDQASGILNGIAGPVTNTTTLAESAVNALKRIDLARAKGGITGIQTGFSKIDEITGGLQPDDMMIVAARPGMGKTAWALDVLLNVANNGYSAAMFTLEMSADQVTDRMISKGVDIPVIRMRSGRLSDNEMDKITTTVDDLTQTPIWIDETAAITTRDLRYRIARLVKKYGVKVVVIDYLQLVTGTQRGTRENEVSDISRTIKRIAKENHISIIALSQLSRAVETRGGGKRPQLSDLRESGSLEQDGDIIAFLYRPEYYGIEEDEQGRSTKGISEFIIGKNRHGACDDITLGFIASSAKFYDIGSFEPLTSVSASQAPW